MHYIYWGSGCSRWVDFKSANILVSIHSLKTMNLGPLRVLGPLFLCRLRSIATHRDHFVRRLSVRHFPKLCFVGDTCIPRNAATIFKEWSDTRTFSYTYAVAGETTRSPVDISIIWPSRFSVEDYFYQYDYMYGDVTVKVCIPQIHLSV